jgi:hypothetical protein
MSYGQSAPKGFEVFHFNTYPPFGGVRELATKGQNVAHPTGVMDYRPSRSTNARLSLAKVSFDVVRYIVLRTAKRQNL